MRYIVLLALVVAACAPMPVERTEINETAVFRVIDGDTFIISNGEFVRILGIDAPEKGEEGYHEAADFLREMIEGQKVELVAEGADRDKYGRLLRHVFRNNTNVAAELLKNRHAFFYLSYEGNYSKVLSEAAR